MSDTSDTSDISESQRRKLRHALGLDNSRIAYRTVYHAPGPSEELDDLVSRGFARKASEGVYHATREGFSEVAVAGESIGPYARFQEPGEQE